MALRCKIVLFTFLLSLFTSCGPSPAEQRRAVKHVQDSIALAEQQRTLTYYQAQLEAILPQADSLIALFKYEPKNEKYQDHGYYVTTARGGTLRILVRDDGKQPVLLYLNGKRIETADDPAVQRAEQLQVTMRDVKELEYRIAKTSLEIQKYEKRLTTEHRQLTTEQ